MPARPSLRTLCSIASVQPSITTKPSDPEDQRGGEREDHEEQAGDEADDRPLDDPRRVAVEGGVGDLLHQLGVGRREVLLDLLQDPLFVLGERHRSRLSVPGLARVAPVLLAVPFSRTARCLSTRSGRPGPSPGRLCADRAPRHPARTGPAPRRPTARRGPASRRPVAGAGSARRPTGPAPVRRPDRGRARRTGRAGAAARRTELLDRDAEQADAVVESGRRRAARGPPRRCRRARSVGSPQRARAGDGAEVAEAHLELDRAARRPTRPAGATPRRRRAARAACSSAAWSWRSTGNVSSWPIDFATCVGLDRARRRGSRPARGGGARRRRRARATSASSGSAASSPTVRDAELGEPALGRRARRPRAARRRAGGGTSSSVPGSTTSRPSGLARSLASLASNLVVADADRRGEPGLVAAPARGSRTAISGPVPCRRRGAADVEERLVERDRLDERRERLAGSP